MRKLLAIAIVVLSPLTALGGETKIWDVSRHDAFLRGEELRELILTSRGELELGYASSAVDVKEEPSFWCGLAVEGGYLAGTGTGSIYRIAGGKADKVGDTKEMLVTSFAASGGAVYAATIPNGRIFKQDGADWNLFATLKSKYVWQLAAAPGGGLYAACGAPGAIYRLDGDGKQADFFAPGKDSALKCENVLSLLVDGEALVAGTAAPGYLLRVEGGKVRVVYDFGDGEVKSLAARGGAIYAAVNSGVKVAPQDFLSAVEQAKQKKDEVQPKEPTPQPAAQSAIWMLSAARTERVAEFPTSYVTELAATEEGIYVGTNNSGRVFRLRPDGDHELLFDFPEKQVLGFVRSDRGVAGALMGGRAALKIFAAERSRKGVYVSDVLDARFQTTWGKLSRRGTGAFTIQTRSGNIAKPGEGWSDWSEPIAGDSAQVPSPKGRYLQFRVTIEDVGTAVRGISIAYRNENQRPRVRGLKVESVPAREAAMAPPPLERGPAPRQGEGHSMIKRLSWRGEDDDGDYLVYRVYYRPVDGGTWLPILGKGSTPMIEYTWNTENVPDGKYVVRVEASDEKANARAESLNGDMETAAIVIDNGKPEIDAAVAGLKVTGAAADKASNITRIEYSVDGGEWFATVPKDGIFDDKREEFEFDLKDVAAGAHTITLRAMDQESNVGTVSKTFEVK